MPIDFGTHHCLNSSGLVHASNTMRAGPLKVRVTTSSRSDFRSTIVRFFMGVDQARAVQAMVDTEVDRRVPAFLRDGCSRRGKVPFGVRPRCLKARGVLRYVHRSDTALAPRLDQ